MAYIEDTKEIEDKLEAIRLGHRDILRLATTLGFGPRFLHAAGPIHKGGPSTGLFLQITAAITHEVPIPGEP